MSYTLDDLYNLPTDPTTYQEARESASGTVPPGRYNIVHIHRAELKLTPENWSTPNRPILDAYVTVANEAGQRTNVGINASPIRITRADKNGVERPDSATQLWGQLVVGLGLKNGATAGDVLGAFENFFTTLTVEVGASFTTPAGKVYLRGKGSDQAYKTNLEAGYEGKNFVNSVGKVS